MRIILINGDNDLIMDTMNMTQENKPDFYECTVLDEQTSINSEILFRYHDVVVIHHHGECYRLRHTRQGKLILTK